MFPLPIKTRKIGKLQSVVKMKPFGEYTLLFVIFFVFNICQGHLAELQKVVVDESIQNDNNSCVQHLTDYRNGLELHQLWALKSKEIFQNKFSMHICF